MLLVGDVHEMPVPASYNDITTNSSIRDYVGWAWYSTQFYVDPRWQEDSKVVLRFGSVHYTAMVYLNSLLDKTNFNNNTNHNDSNHNETNSKQ